MDKNEALTKLMAIGFSNNDAEEILDGIDPSAYKDFVEEQEKMWRELNT